MDEQNKKKIEIYLMKTFCLLEKKTFYNRSMMKKIYMNYTKT